MQDNEAREWLAGLPEQLEAQRRIMTRLLDLCVAELGGADLPGRLLDRA